jgi:hypothetical protein
MIVDNIVYTHATLKDFVNLPAALNAFADCHLADILEIPGASIPAGRATNDAMREYETNDNNVVKEVTSLITGLRRYRFLARSLRLEQGHRVEPAQQS